MNCGEDDSNDICRLVAFRDIHDLPGCDELLRINWESKKCTVCNRATVCETNQHGGNQSKQAGILTNGILRLMKGYAMIDSTAKIVKTIARIETRELKGSGYLSRC